jgi:hypothetical protein
MKVILKATFLTALLAASVILVHSEPTNAPEYSKAQINQMAHQARTTQQYRTLADYFRGQLQKFDQGARSEKQEWVAEARIQQGWPTEVPQACRLFKESI